MIPDRIETATFACAAASAGGEIRLRGTRHRDLTAVLDVLERAGCRIHRNEHDIEIASGERKSPGVVETGPYPGFPTDAQATVMAALLRAEGETEIRETVFPNRMGHVNGLRRLGADISREGNRALLRKSEKLSGAPVTATDLRGGAALAVAALAAHGQTEISGLHHILRGYENFAGKLRTLGADARLT